MTRALPLAALILAGAAAAALAQSRAVVVLAVGEGELIRLGAPAATVFVANPEIADVQIAGPQSIFLFGAATGRTTFFALDENGAPIAEREVRVEHDLGGVRRILAQRFPNTRVEVTSGPKSVMISGVADTPEEADAIAATVQGALGEGETLINRLAVTTPVQVNLRVRVSEVSRNIDERLGFNWSALFNVGDFAFGVATGRGLLAAGNFLLGDGDNYGSFLGSYQDDNVNINLVLDALDREGLARTLAEPNLTALSGETASFTAGGEFPIPVAQDGDRTTVEFKPFGVILDFTPTVLSADRISLRVRPEVSDLTDLGAIRIDDFEIPALTVRRVDTTVELASGQSLVIGGLLQQTSRDAIDKVPGLGDLPVLGSLFTSTRYQNAETELIVTVTPYIVRATSPDRLSNPLGPRATGRSLEALLLGRADGSPPGASPGRLNGPVGFVY